MRGTLHGGTLDPGRQRDWAGDARAGAFDGVRDVAGGLVNDPMVKGLQSDANALSCHRKNNFIVMVKFKYRRLPASGNGGRIYQTSTGVQEVFERILAARAHFAST